MSPAPARQSGTDLAVHVPRHHERRPSSAEKRPPVPLSVHPASGDEGTPRYQGAPHSGDCGDIAAPGLKGEELASHISGEVAEYDSRESSCPHSQVTGRDDLRLWHVGVYRPDPLRECLPELLAPFGCRVVADDESLRVALPDETSRILPGLDFPGGGQCLGRSLVLPDSWMVPQSSGGVVWDGHPNLRVDATIPLGGLQRRSDLPVRDAASRCLRAGSDHLRTQ